jgi:hypothetical protein
MAKERRADKPTAFLLTTSRPVFVVSSDARLIFVLIRVGGESRWIGRVDRGVGSKSCPSVSDIPPRVSTCHMRMTSDFLVREAGANVSPTSSEASRLARVSHVALQASSF